MIMINENAKMRFNFNSLFIIKHKLKQNMSNVYTGSSFGGLLEYSAWKSNGLSQCGMYQHSSSYPAFLPAAVSATGNYIK